MGTGGVLPVSICYLSELTPSYGRSRLLGALGALGLFGGLLFCYIGQLILPSNGALIISEMSSEHFTSWHRFLLYCSLPTLFSIFGLFYLPESPRYLLENNREVEALSIYQRIYRQNRSRGGYSLTELELPALRNHRQVSSSVVDEIFQSFHQYFGGFLQLFNKSYMQTTIFIICVWFSGDFLKFKIVWIIFHWFFRLSRDYGVSWIDNLHSWILKVSGNGNLQTSNGNFGKFSINHRNS